MAQITAVTDALRAEAGKWRRLSDQADGASRAAARLTLDPAAFFIGGDLALHSRAYAAFQSAMVTVLAGAGTEFERLGGVLDRIADAYDQADAVVAVNLDEIPRR
nr:hypothetical protein [Micromonospora sp. DSM 115978]